MVFLIDDRHFPEIIRLQPAGCYPLYDVTSSGITSGIHDITGTPEMQNPHRVPGMLLLQNNLIKVSLSGPYTGRATLFQALNRTGPEQLCYTIRARKLHVP